MAINKFQRSWLTLALSAKVAHIVVPSIYFSQTIGPIELKFYVKTPYDKLAKIIQYILVTGQRWPPHPYMVKTKFDLDVK